MANYNSKLRNFLLCAVVFGFSFLVFNFVLVPAAQAQGLTLAPKCNPTLPPNLSQLPEETKNELIEKAGKEGKPTVPCDIPAFITWVRQVIRFLLTVAIPLGIVFVSWGGFVIMTAGGSDEKVKKGKDIVLASVIGIAIALAAWLIVITVDKILRGGI